MAMNHNAVSASIEQVSRGRLLFQTGALSRLMFAEMVREFLEGLRASANWWHRIVLSVVIGLLGRYIELE